MLVGSGAVIQTAGPAAIVSYCLAGALVLCSLRMLGEMVVACIVPVDGAEIDETALTVHLKEKLASFKVPRHVRFVDEWPMSATKIQRFRLREQLVAELGA